MAFGGAAGAVVRFAFTYFSKLYLYNYFFVTLCINVIGSFFIGYLVSLGIAKNLSASFIKYFLIIGFLGSFTTFSAFSFEVVELFLLKKYYLSFLYIFLTIFLCIVAAYIGMYINNFD